MARKKGPQIEQAFEAIRDKIVTFELLPGTVVSDSSLAEELSMSRTPVREAILLLNSVGLIEIKDGKTRVAPIGLSDIIEICEVREAIECASVSIIMENGGLKKDQRKKLGSIFESLTGSLFSEKLNDNYRYDDLFHASIVEFSNNSRLMSISDSMRLQIQRARWLNVAFPANRREAAHLEHQRIFDSVMAGDGEACILSIKDHISKSKEHFKKIINDPNMRIAMLGIRSIYQGDE